MSITISLSPEAHRRLIEVASKERRRLYAQAAWMLEQLLLQDDRDRERDARLAAEVAAVADVFRTELREAGLLTGEAPRRG